MRWQRILAWALGLVLAAAILGLWGVSRWIESDVVAISQDATQHFPGDRVEALIAYVDCAACELRRRNLAAWALGQLGDQRALSPLKKHYTGQPCGHSSNLCQRELKKAIRLLEGGVNITRVFRPR